MRTLTPHIKQCLLYTCSLAAKRDDCQDVQVWLRLVPLPFVPLKKDPQGMHQIRHMHALRYFLYCSGQILRNKSIFQLYFILVDEVCKISFLLCFKIFLCLGRVFVGFFSLLNGRLFKD